MSNFFDMKSRNAMQYVDGLIAEIKRELDAKKNQS
jgi:hypothetical protein